MLTYADVTTYDGAQVRRIVTGRVPRYHEDELHMITPDALAMSPALQNKIAQASREISATTFGVLPARQAEINRSPSLTPEHWRSIRAQLTREPHLIAVWFVNTPDLFLFAHANWPQPSRLGLWYPSLVLFDTESARSQDWLLAPWFASFPGVWAEMADGRHIRFIPKGYSGDADS